MVARVLAATILQISLMMKTTTKQPMNFFIKRVIWGSIWLAEILVIRIETARVCSRIPGKQQYFFTRAASLMMCMQILVHAQILGDCILRVMESNKAPKKLKNFYKKRANLEKRLAAKHMINYQNNKTINA